MPFKATTNIPAILSDTQQHGRIIVPNECPICHISIYPHLLTAFSIPSNTPPDYASFFFSCPNCNKVYGTSAEIYFQNFSTHSFICDLSTKEASFSPCIPKIPPLPLNLQQEAFKKFQAVYKDTYSADSYGLFEVAGMGYRKCIEFLIKDFLLLTHPEKRETVENPKIMLGNLIKDHMKEDDLSSLQLKLSNYNKLATDEVHYIKHSGFGIDTIREFFNYLVKLIDDNLEGRKLEALFQK